MIQRPRAVWVEPISAVGTDDFRSRPAVETAQKEETH